MSSAADRSIWMKGIEDQLSLEFTPLWMILLIMLFSGIAGNSFMVYIYGVAVRTQTAFTVFSTTLAVSDLLMCLVFIPMAMYELRYSLTGWTLVSCKIFRTCMMYFLTLSAFLLLLISFDRYKKVCHPLKMTRTVYIQLQCVIAVLAAAALVAPTVVMYSIHPTLLAVRKDLNKFGVACDLEKSMKETNFGKVFSAFLFSLFPVVLFIVCILYLLVLYHLYQEKKEIGASQKDTKNMARTDPHVPDFSRESNLEPETFGRTRYPFNVNFNETGSLENATRDNRNKLLTQDLADVIGSKWQTNQMQSLSVRSVQSLENEANLLQDRPRSTSMAEKYSRRASTMSRNLSAIGSAAGYFSLNMYRESRGVQSLSRSSVSFVLIVITYIISLSSATIISMRDTFNESFNKSIVESSMFCKLLLVMVYLHSCTNPVINGFLNKHFRKEIKRIFNNINRNIAKILFRRHSEINRNKSDGKFVK